MEKSQPIAGHEYILKHHGSKYYLKALKQLTYSLQDWKKHYFSAQP